MCVCLETDDIDERQTISVVVRCDLFCFVFRGRFVGVCATVVKEEIGRSGCCTTVLRRRERGKGGGGYEVVRRC